MKSLRKYLDIQYTKATADRYYRDILIFLGYFSQEKAQIATFKDIMEYIGHLRKQNHSPANIKVILHGIKKYYNWLYSTEQRPDHPCKGLKLKDKISKDIQLQDLFTTEELELLLNRNERYKDLELKNKTIISLLIYQGLTTGEIINLRLNDIDLKEAAIYIRSTNKTNSRTLKLKAKQVMLLQAYINETRPKLIKKDTDRLIINQRGNIENGEGINYLTSTYKKLFLDRKLNPVTIRQSVIANLLKQGNDLRIVQTFAGHKYPSTTERYKQTGIEELKAGIEKYHPLGQQKNLSKTD